MINTVFCLRETISQDKKAVKLINQVSVLFYLLFFIFAN